MTGPVPGMMITPSLRLERPLARGGMGAVWIATHTGLHTKVVVKFLVEELATNADALARFKREAAAASQVKSPHVVQMIDHGITSAGLPYIAMERLVGYSLAQHLEDSPVVPPKQTALVISQAAKALARAHDSGVIHRDIKPDNLFLCDDGSSEAFVKVLDFGIAKVADTANIGATKTGSMVGTVYYMSPEQVMGRKDLDHRADVWALAVAAYEMLSGVRPFEGETLGAISVAICNSEHARASTVRESISPEIDAVLEKALAKEIGDRFQSAREFADALTRACGGVEPLPLIKELAEPPSEAQMMALAPTEQPVMATPQPASANTPAPAVALSPLAFADAASGTGPSGPRPSLADASSALPAIAPAPAKSNAGIFVAGGVAALAIIVVGGLFALKALQPTPVVEATPAPMVSHSVALSASVAPVASVMPSATSMPAVDSLTVNAADAGKPTAASPKSSTKAALVTTPTATATVPPKTTAKPKTTVNAPVDEQL